MGYSIPDFTLTLLAGADLSAKQFHAVKLNSSGKVVLASDGDKIVGILQDDPENGQAGVIMVSGASPVIFGDTVTAGQEVQANAAGKIITKASGVGIGFCLEGGTVNKVGTILIK